MEAFKEPIQETRKFGILYSLKFKIGFSEGGKKSNETTGTKM